MNEIWERWEPVAGLRDKYCVEYIDDRIDCFRVRLYWDYYNDPKRVDIFFENSVDSYRRTEEMYRHGVVLDLDKRYGKEFYAPWTLFKITNSKYIKWLSDESCTISDHMPLIHFVMLAADSLVDIVTTYEPKVEHVTVKLPTRKDVG